MKRVKQKDRTGCGIACVAMLANKTYSQVKKKMKSLDCFKGHRKNVFLTDYPDLKKALKAYKIKSSKVCNKKSWKSTRKNAIVAINYNKKRDEWHWVVYDKKKECVIDPRTKKPYRKTSDKRMRIKSWVYIN